MRIKNGFLLRRIMDRWIVVPTGSATARSGGMLSLNESSAVLWEALKEGSNEKSLTVLLCEKYDTDQETAQSDVCKFLQKLDELGALLLDEE